MSWFKNSGGEGPEMTTDPFKGQVPQRPAPPVRLSAPFEPVTVPTAGVRAEPRLPGTLTSPAPAPIPAGSADVKPRGSVLGPTLRFRGELRADEDLVIQGQIEGSIHHTQSLIVGTDGCVRGNTRARSISVEGTVEGDLYAVDSIAIRATAKVNGNLSAPRISIADGAVFNGKVDMSSAAKPNKLSEEPGGATTLDVSDIDALMTGS